LFFGAIIALTAGLLGPTSSAVAANVSVTNVTITGTPVVGQPLSASAQVTPGNATKSYQWQTKDAQDVVANVGTNSATFTPTSNEVGKRIQVVVTGTSGADTGSATSALTTAVLDVFTAAPAVGVDDSTPVVDAPITASVTTGSTPAADSYTYQWYAGANPISGATNATYTPVAGDVGKTLLAKVTAIKQGFLSITGSSSATSAVAKADFTTLPTVTITGTAQVDQVLTASASGEVPSGSGTYTYQWLADAVEINGATSATFTPGPNQVGKKITVEATTTKAGYNDAVNTSAETLPVALAVFSTYPTAIVSTMTPKVGDVIRASADGEVPVADSYEYQWYRISTLGVRSAIPLATSDTYTVLYTDLTKRIQVEIYAKRAGYVTDSDLSVPTDRVNYIALSKVSVARGQSLGVNAKRLRAGQAYKIYIDGISVYKGTTSSDGTAARTVTVPKTITAGTKRVWVSGYTKDGVRDFQVMTTVIVT
jgi:hypothetical protein